MAKIKNHYCTLYIVRHGETNENLNHVIQGQTDSSLNETGKQQAKNISEKLKNIKFDNIFSSDLSRAKETADIIAINRQIAIQTTKSLRERNWGRLEGKSTELAHQIEKLKAKLTENEKNTYKPHPEIESDEEIISRFITFLREIAVGYKGKTILIVGHGGLNRTILFHFLNMDLNGFWKIKQDNCCLNIIDLNKPASRVSLLNSTCFLREKRLQKQDVLA